MTPKRHVLPIFVPHLGCPNDCVFCNQRRISGRLQPATPETVKQMLEHMPVMTEDAPKQLAFYGGSFTAIPVSEQEALLDAAKPFLERYKNAGLRISTRPDFIDNETLVRLKKHGVATIEIGAQSMCEDVLAASGRGHTAMDTTAAAKLIKSFGFELILQMMTGLPEDTPEKSVITAKKIIGLQPDGVRIYPTVVIRDTRLHDMWKSGCYRAHTVEDAVSLCAELFTLFEKAHIPIIRLGLNPTEELSGGAAAAGNSGGAAAAGNSGGAAVAGAYHPAFGELVISRVYLNRARELLKGKGTIKKVVFGVAPRRVSVMSGHKRCNILALQEEFACKDIRVSGVDSINCREGTIGSKATYGNYVAGGEIVILDIENTP